MRCPTAVLPGPPAKAEEVWPPGATVEAGEPALRGQQRAAERLAEAPGAGRTWAAIPQRLAVKASAEIPAARRARTTDQRAAVRREVVVQTRPPGWAVEATEAGQAVGDNRAVPEEWVERRVAVAAEAWRVAVPAEAPQAPAETRAEPAAMAAPAAAVRLPVEQGVPRVAAARVAPLAPPAPVACFGLVTK
jgi:hypothetical protein